jgi:hypothetical protein
VTGGRFIGADGVLGEAGVIAVTDHRRLVELSRERAEARVAANADLHRGGVVGQRDAVVQAERIGRDLNDLCGGIEQDGRGASRSRGQADDHECDSVDEVAPDSH